MFDYPMTLTRDGDTVCVTFADVPEAITFGADEEEALLHAVDALETGLSFYIDARQPLPTPSKPKRGQKTVRPGTLASIRRMMTEAATGANGKSAPSLTLEQRLALFDPARHGGEA